MQRSTILLFGSLIVGLALVFTLMRGERETRTNGSSAGGDAVQPLMLYCAASNRAVIEAVIADYKQEFAREVQVQYGPSQTLLSSMSVSKSGDLYLPADSSYIDMAREKGLVAEVLPLAKMHAVIAVAQGNPKGIQSFDDLLKPGVRLVQASPDAAAITKVTRQQLQKLDLWDKLAQATTAYRTTVNDAASDIVVGAADAAIVYDAVLHTYPKLQAVKIPELANVVSDVALAVTKSTEQASAALHFARFASARDRGLKKYTEFGFQVVKGDVWQDKPELSIFAGSMLRPAIDSTITEFEKREGVRVVRVYNGCGILVAQMKAGQHPDAYFACDKEFMNSVPDLFPSPVDVSQNELVIMVQKGNPHGIRDLRDLGKPGLRVGVGHEKQCAMGWLTQNPLREGGVEKEVMANVTVQSPTGDMLVNQLRASSLDAAVAYLSNAAGAGDVLDAVRIVGIPCSVATQPFAVAVDSPNAHLAGRLFELLNSAESKETFLAEVFQWSADLKPELKGDLKSKFKTSPQNQPESDASASNANTSGANTTGEASGKPASELPSESGNE
ncbi:MAG: substrate-binding domain-containing protein [Pirellulaceae bacterium]|nr:substrate-binding domain-containing protein [Pirellulaceae bacterium]